MKLDADLTDENADAVVNALVAEINDGLALPFFQQAPEQKSLALDRLEELYRHNLPTGTQDYDPVVHEPEIEDYPGGFKQKLRDLCVRYAYPVRDED